MEEALKSHPAVRDSTVVGLPDDRWGQAVTALVSLDYVVSDEELLAHARTQIAAYKTPKKVLRVSDIKRGPNGKADYEWALKTAKNLSQLE